MDEEMSYYERILRQAIATKLITLCKSQSAHCLGVFAYVPQKMYCDECKREIYNRQKRVKALSDKIFKLEEE